MRIINRDLTKEKITVYTTDHQIYAKIFSKTNGKWEVTTYFKDFTFEVDEELINSSIKEIIRTFGLRNPRVVVE